VRDTREQAGFDFRSITPPPAVISGTLPTGDYSLQGFEGRITVERKSLPDAFGSFGKDRARFERELSRLAKFEFAAVVIEADWRQILRQPPKFSRLNPNTVLRSVIAWQQRFGVHFWPCPDRLFAEKITYRLLERYWIDQQKYVHENAYDISTK
jgi:ERCC4-type nuclease